MLIALAGAKGAPGVTTTARVLAAVWPRPVVLADCDLAGGDLALLGRTPDGGVLDPDTGLLSLAAEARRGVPVADLDDHLQQVEGGLDVLCGVAGPEQVTGIGPVMPAVATALARQPGRDVVVDCGRVAPGSAVVPVLAAADVVLFVVRPRLEAYGHLRERLRWMAGVRDAHGRGPALGVAVVTTAPDHRSTKDLAQLLAHSGVEADVVGRVAEDARAADVVAGRLQRGIAHSLLVRSVRELVEPLHHLAARRVGEPATY
ncbi:hypothetical protein Q9R32_14615 [Actinotalea sp. AC32]|nr:hypothetical protein [Actinotalea sp. AC32]